MNKEQIENIFKLSSLYVATTIGAGFASGKELFLFFTKYESSSKYGLYLSGSLFIFVGFLMLDYIRIRKPDNLIDLLKSLVGTKLSLILSILISVFLLGVLSIMLSGMANIVTVMVDIDPFVSSIVVTLLCYIVLIFGINAIVVLSQVITPFLIIGIFVLCTLLLKTDSSTAILTNSVLLDNWGISGITYISYNILVSFVVLIDAKFLLLSRKICILSALLGGIGLFSTSYFINLVLLKYYPLIIHQELPMLALAKNYNLGVFYIWSAILFLSMLTTAVSSALGCIHFITQKIKIPYNLLVFIFMCVTLRLSYIGFSQLILIFYPLFGYLGIILILLLCFKYTRLENF